MVNTHLTRCGFFSEMFAAAARNFYNPRVFSFFDIGVSCKYAEVNNLQICLSERNASSLAESCCTLWRAATPHWEAPQYHYWCRAPGRTPDSLLLCFQGLKPTETCEKGDRAGLWSCWPGVLWRKNALKHAAIFSIVKREICFVNIVKFGGWRLYSGVERPIRYLFGWGIALISTS